MSLSESSDTERFLARGICHSTFVRDTTNQSLPKLGQFLGVSLR